MTLAEMMEGPEHWPHGLKLRQVGWLGQTGALYPWGTPEDEIRSREPGSYSPIYIELEP